jgi:protein ImuB
MFAALHAPGNLPLLLVCAEHFSPLIEELPPDTVVFDIHGLRLIFGTPQEIAAEIHRRVGIPAHIAIASNPDAAVHTARGIKGVTVIAPRQEAATLAPLPLYLLGGSPEFARTMDLWGLRTFGEFAALPPLGVAARLGEEGVLLQRLAQGARNRLLRLRSDALRFQEEQELESPVDLIEPLLLLLSGMLQQMCARLRSHSLATNEVRLLLKLERAPEHSTSLRLPVPMFDPKVLLKLLQLELSVRPPQAPVEKIRIELIPVETRAMQHGLYLPSSPEPEKLEITLARIRNLVGANNVGSPAVFDTHRPDSFRMSSLNSAQENVVSAPRMVLRRFRPPCPAQVWCTGNGQPARIFSSQGEWRVTAAAGPWSTSGDWWSGDFWDREEWDLEVSERGIFRVHQDRESKRWFVEGSYD